MRLEHNAPLIRVMGLSLALAGLSPASAALTLTQTDAPDFGLLLGGASGRQFILNTDSTITGTHSADYLSGAATGRFVVEDTTSPASVNIQASTVGTFGGLSVGSVLCSYAGGAQQTCSGSGMTVTSSSTAALNLGLEITTSTAHGGGDTASATIEVTLSYL